MYFVEGDSDSINGMVAKRWMEGYLNEEFEHKYMTLSFLGDDNKIKTSFLFTNYNGFNIEFHFCGERLSTKMVRTVLNYVFNKLKCARLTVIPLREDAKSIIALKRLGFLHEATLKNYYGIDDAKDGLVFVMKQDRAKDWITIE